MYKIQPCSIGVGKNLVKMIENNDCTETEDNRKKVFWNISFSDSNVDEERENYDYMKQLYYLIFSHCV